MAREAAVKTGEVEFFVSPKGNDRWSGKCPAPNKRGTDGPFATLEAAQRAVRNLRRKKTFNQTIRVHLRGGTYYLKKPLVFGPRDSGIPIKATWEKIIEPEHPVFYCAYKSERPVISGGRRITKWKKSKLNGRTVWVANLPEVKKGTWYFRQLWVNGQRRYRPRLPKEGEFKVEKVLDDTGFWKGTNRFGYAEGDIRTDWKNLEDVELRFPACWELQHLKIKSVDSKDRIVVLDRTALRRFTMDWAAEGAPYTVENVFEELKRPGQWYLDRPEGKLYYIPMPGENPGTAEVIAPRLTELVRLEGGADEKEKVQSLRFEGISFMHNEWAHPANWVCSSQAANEVPGVVVLRHVYNCIFRRCTFTHVGTYAVDMAEGCRDDQVLGCDMLDLGGGGVKIWHGCRRNTVADCEIGDGGILYPDAVGVLIGKATGNQVVHNHIHDLYYSGVSVGWTWGYAESDGYGNIVEWNHIHDLGKGQLSDLGGIYTLGVAPGTRLRYNLIHDINCRTYGGWAIYPDEGSMRLLIENNIGCRCNDSCFHEHYGRENIVQNNIFAFGGAKQIALSRLELHCSLIFRRNIVYYDTGEVMVEGYANKGMDPSHAVFEKNLYFHAGGKKPTFFGMSFQKWQERGMDKGSIVADPRFVNPKKGNFGLKKNSPAQRIGFVPFDLSAVGPRPKERR